MASRSDLGRPSAAALAALLLAGCSDEVEDRKAELNMMKAARVSPAKLCEQQKKVTAAYLKNRDQHGYELQSLTEALDCQAVTLGIDYRTNGLEPEPDNMEVATE